MSIKDHFTDKDVGEVDSLCGKIDNVPLRVFDMKEEDYVVMLMSTYGENERVGEGKFRIIGGEMITFKYPESVHNCYQHRDTVDSHNVRRQAYIAMEETWSTRRWEKYNFVCLLAISGVNANLGEHYVGGVEAGRPMLEFRRLLFRDLLNNPSL